MTEKPWSPFAEGGRYGQAEDQWHLLLGAGSRHVKHLGAPEWGKLVTLDAEERHKPDVIFDLEKCIGEEGKNRPFYVRKSEAERIKPALEWHGEISGAWSSDTEHLFHGWCRGRLPFLDNFFDEVHAYEVLEHVGAQGDARKFFEQFTEFWRVLRPGGILYGSVPDHRSLWAWSDPSHKRIITQGTLTFLVQPAYTEQVGKTAMSDFRSLYKADFDLVHSQTTGAESGDVSSAQYFFGLRAVKPSRWEPGLVPPKAG